MPKLNWTQFALLLIVAAILPAFAGSAYTRVLLNMAVINAILALGFYAIFGMAGILSISQGAFWAVGAYTSALLTVDAHQPFWVGLVAAGSVAGLAGVGLGLPTLKLRSHYLTLTTIAFSEVVRLLLINWGSITHGPLGVRNIPPAAIGPVSLESPVASYYLGLGILILLTLLLVSLRASRFGRALEALREEELAATAMGVKVAQAKVLAFAISAVYAGVAGSLYAHLTQYVSPDTFSLDVPILILAMVMIGGRHSAVGAIAGAVALTYLPEVLRFMQDWYMAVYAAGLLLTLIFAPDGLIGLMGRLGRRGKGVAG